MDWKIGTGAWREQALIGGTAADEATKNLTIDSGAEKVSLLHSARSCVTLEK